MSLTQQAGAPPSHTLSITITANRSFQIETSSDLFTWIPWDVPGNGGLPVAGGNYQFTPPALDERQFFRVKLWDN